MFWIVEEVSKPYLFDQLRDVARGVNLVINMGKFYHLLDNVSLINADFLFTHLDCRFFFIVFLSMCLNKQPKFQPNIYEAGEERYYFGAGQIWSPLSILDFGKIQPL